MAVLLVVTIPPCGSEGPYDAFRPTDPSALRERARSAAMRVSAEATVSGDPVISS